MSAYLTGDSTLVWVISKTSHTIFTQYPYYFIPHDHIISHILITQSYHITNRIRTQTRCPVKYALIIQNPIQNPIQPKQIKNTYYREVRLPISDQFRKSKSNCKDCSETTRRSRNSSRTHNLTNNQYQNISFIFSKFSSHFLFLSLSFLP